MTARGVVLPCAILGTIVAVGFLFMWWFFPHMWKKGTKQELEELTTSAGNGHDQTQSERVEIAGERAREYVKAMEIRYKARAEGRELDEPPPVYRPL